MQSKFKFKAQKQHACIVLIPCVCFYLYQTPKIQATGLCSILSNQQLAFFTTKIIIFTSDHII